MAQNTTGQEIPNEAKPMNPLLTSSKGTIDINSLIGKQPIQQTPQQTAQQTIPAKVEPTPKPAKQYPATPSGTQVTQKPDMQAQLADIQRQAENIKKAIDQKVIEEQKSTGTLDVLNKPEDLRATVDTSIDTTKMLTDFYNQIKPKIDAYFDPNRSQESFVQEYNRLRDEQGLPALEGKISDITNIINKTDDDIRAELTAGDGFATESQIAALGAARNKVLINELDSLTELKKQKQDYIDRVVELTGKDKDEAAKEFDKMFNYQDKLITLSDKIDQSGFKNTLQYYNYQQKQKDSALKDLDFLAKKGTLGSLTDEQLQEYSDLTGFPISQLKSAASNADADYSLRNQILSKRMQTSSGSILDGNTIDFLSTYFLTTGIIPSLGMGASNTRAEILSGAAAKANAAGMTGSDLAVNQASYSANKTALNNLQKVYSQVTVNEQQALKNFDQLQELSKKVDRSGSTVANRYLLKLKGQYAGDADTQAFESVLVTAATEYAKVVSGQTGGAAVTDAARKEIQEVLNPAMSDKALNTVIPQLKREMRNRITSFEGQISTLKSNIQNQSGSNSPLPSNVETTPEIDKWAASLKL